MGGPDDACFVAGANWVKNSGIMCVWGSPCAVQKWFIEWSKVDECAFGVIGRLIWHFVHHTPVHLFGGGPLWSYLTVGGCIHLRCGMLVMQLIHLLRGMLVSQEFAACPTLV